MLLLFEQGRTACSFTSVFPVRQRRSHVQNPTRLGSTPPSATFDEKRTRILERPQGEFFELNSEDGTVQFGSVATLVTTLESNPKASDVIAKWLINDDRVASSIWDRSMMKDLGDSVYRLELMSLQFVTIKLAPTVDVRMWSERPGEGEATLSTSPLFKIDSIAFDPNIKILPGVGVTAESLGIQIDVVGELGLAADGTGLSGSLGFAAGGKLPRPLQILPTSVIKNAVDTINQQIVRFAVKNFEAGVIKEYGKYRQEVIKKFEENKRLKRNASS